MKRWSYDGTRGEMCLYDVEGEPVLVLPLSIEAAHHLAHYIEERERDMRSNGRAYLMLQIAQLSDNRSYGE